MKIIQRRETRSRTEYFRCFSWADQESKYCGFGFDCNEDGTPIINNDDARKNYEACLTGVVDGKRVIDHGVEQRTCTWKEPQIGLCVCGEEVVLEYFTCTCHRCGRNYNSAGQELAPRSQWGEETGETLADIMAADTFNPFDED